MDNKSKECIQECDDLSKKAGKKAKKLNCQELLEKIKELTDTEKKGGDGGTKGLLQRFRDYRGDDNTHGPEILKNQRSLRTYLKEYDKKGCGDPPGNAEEVAYRPLPVIVPMVDGKTVVTGTVVVGTVGIGYAIYRAIRFLPSLVPPLWWTIPENLAIP